MALGIFSSSSDKDLSNDDLKKNSEDLRDAEKQSTEVGGGRRMSRIGGVNRQDMASDDEQSISVGKQIEMESGNAIKYLTCSWQKVCFLTLRLWRGQLYPESVISSIVYFLTNLDCRSFVF